MTDLSEKPARRFSHNDLYEAVKKAKIEHPFDKKTIHSNPYTGELILDSASYERYIREHAYYDLCDRMIAENPSASEKEMRREIDRLQENLSASQEKTSTAERAVAESETKFKKRRKILLIICALFLIALIVSHIVSSNRIDSAFEDGLTAGYDKGYEVGNSDGYESGYTAGSADGHKSGYAEGKADGYESGYAEGKTDGYENGYDDGKAEGRRYSYFSYSYANTGTGGTRAAPIAYTYIGNKNTHKYHLPTCSYLPDQSNQVIFSSAAEAEAAGYAPCQKCNP